ncbi:DUF2461 domain-containing protein [Agromyces sp. Soil535]|uniref:DUF2461 domain-containing protein n=1 Tax=Agromyces sp. Soil535 TaxID=1736390 RepID=UPI0006F54A72|nr:DUF2461 domain-containing protein [Agromyces sp. Soil535]KRE26118.1 hypothetical protein ASG80_04755 [Agromyces sp. Soil535]
MGEFTGWPGRALEFYSGLEADNSKAYWTAHRSEYDTFVLGPMQALLEDLEGEFGEGRIFRPYRDIRFSADKTPYKTAIGATLGGSGYVHFSASGLGVGAGCHVMAPDQLARFRAAVEEDLSGEALIAAVAALEADGVSVTARERLKRVPRGVDPEHPRADLLRDKDLAAWIEWPVSPWLHTAAAEDRVAEALRASRPLTDWLDAHVGPSAAERTR